MREHGIRARYKRRFKATTDSKHSMPVAPSRVWTGNITCIRTGEGWLSLAIVLDLFNREIVGWSIKPRVTADIVTDAFPEPPAGPQRAGHDQAAEMADVVKELAASIDVRTPWLAPARTVAPAATCTA